jgi:hypothetical protein
MGSYMRFFNQHECGAEVGRELRTYEIDTTIPDLRILDSRTNSHNTINALKQDKNDLIHVVEETKQQLVA